MDKLKIEKFNISDVLAITPVIKSDMRGFFCETYSKKLLSEFGVSEEYVQDNHSMSVDVGVVRGLHFQIEPYAQCKLVRVIRGEILDVVVDLRKKSPTYGKHLSIILSAENRRQLRIPKGLAHGFCTLTPHTEVTYKVSEYYYPYYDKGLAWDDPNLGISWPIGKMEAILSDRDRQHPGLHELPAYFL